jgi:antitoxin component of MazEF toxin-antitoxin module
MADKIQIVRVGNSHGIILNKGVLQAYNLKLGDEMEIEFNYPDIILRTKPKKKGLLPELPPIFLNYLFLSWHKQPIID